MSLMNQAAQIQIENGHLLVSGDLDFRNVVLLWNNSLPLLANCSEFKFDLSNVSVSKSAGLSLLIEWIKLAHREKKSISFKNIPSKLMSIAALCNVDHILKPLIKSS